MMMITPVEQYSNNYIFNVFSMFSTNYITVYVAPDDYDPENIVVDETDLQNAEWTTVYCSNATICGYIAYVTLTSGQHQLYHRNISARLGISAYGFNFHNSYGYPGGLKLTAIQCKSLVCNCDINSISLLSGMSKVILHKRGENLGARIMFYTKSDIICKLDLY